MASSGQAEGGRWLNGSEGPCRRGQWIRTRAAARELPGEILEQKRHHGVVATMTHSHKHC